MCHFELPMCHIGYQCATLRYQCATWSYECATLGYTCAILSYQCATLVTNVPQKGYQCAISSSSLSLSLSVPPFNDFFHYLFLSFVLLYLYPVFSLLFFPVLIFSVAGFEPLPTSYLSTTSSSSIPLHYEVQLKITPR